MSRISDLMFHGHRRLRGFLHRNTFSQPPPPTSKCQLKPFFPYPLSIVSHNLFSTTCDSSDKQSFTVSYLTNTCGFSSQAALKASKRVRFNDANKPDSVIAFFTNHGFSNSQIHSIIRRVPEVLLFDPTKRVLPKFQFLASKGSDIVTTVTRTPYFMLKSLENHIIPAFQFVRRFSPSDEKAIVCALFGSTNITIHHMKSKVKLLLDMGVTPANIYLLLITGPSLLRCADLKEAVEELKGLGFHPSKALFVVALQAKRAITKSLWDAKLDAFKIWGWSEDAILDAFRRNPHIMLYSIKKVNAVMSFWVGYLGWDHSVLQAQPALFGFSLEKRLRPRASVLQYLLSRGLIKKDASLTTPFMYTDKLFLQKFVNSFEEEETSKLLSLYREEH
ncbi:uncharacterized protein LOC130712067 [Lotus japonicus]|uniref:uncharacterized protein LOC130712067 n=1 Tax=Lotus japonicus TaxID=34305 RepID=UPI00258DF980|nr:uncharacterized protein LOC130712067 [Lotus japonicus]XP_057417884.1 uncharacterized protein LOC130712067 [Lotus japonicus]